ncbi:MAG TPA: hypothetical protein VGP89_18040 [Candidatus Angelobacter sp.]|jgi:hypothetical protein|nr:hypothetical protein [Candidatus Angelobacter sp.]
MALQEVQTGNNVDVYIYKVTLSGSYVQAVRGANTGEQLKPFAASNPNFLPKAFPGNKGFKRGYVIQGGAGNGTEIIPGADIFTWLLKFFSAANTELAAAGYNAAVTGDVDFMVAFESDPTN